MLVLLASSHAASEVNAGQITLTSAKDNTLYQFDPADASTSLASNGSGDFFSAGRTLNRSQIRRGLLAFDFTTLPIGARVQEGSLTLQLYVVDAPRRDASGRPFWFVAAPSDWGEGASSTTTGVSGSGSGAGAAAGDATWFHREYDPTVHDASTFSPGGAGYWDAPGILGSNPINTASAYGAPLGVIPSEIGFVTLHGATLEAQVNAWLAGAANYGWLVLGDETLATDDVSSLRGFASREHANPAFRPSLSFAYTIPEPETCVLVGIALLLAAQPSASGPHTKTRRSRAALFPSN